MLLVLSPAKTLNMAPALKRMRLPLTRPELADEAAALAAVARGQDAADLQRLMGISEELAALNVQRFQEVDPASGEGVQAALAFAGDVYRGLQARTLDGRGLRWAQDHVRILSGLYGVLRPLDAIQAYRLEMGVSLATERGGTLYDWWGGRVAETLAAAAAEHRDRTVVNLASAEYFGAVDRPALNLPVVTCRFLEEKDGEARMIGTFAKTARGLMARWAIDQRIRSHTALKRFDIGGYRFSKVESTADSWAFVRPQPAAKR